MKRERMRTFRKTASGQLFSMPMHELPSEHLTGMTLMLIKC